MVLSPLVVQSNESQLSHVSVSELLGTLQNCLLPVSDVQPTLKAAPTACLFSKGWEPHALKLPALSSGDLKVHKGAAQMLLPDEAAYSEHRGSIDE